MAPLVAYPAGMLYGDLNLAADLLSARRTVRLTRWKGALAVQSGPKLADIDLEDSDDGCGT